MLAPIEMEARPLTSHQQVNGLPPILTFCDVLETRNGEGPSYSEGLAAAFNITVALEAFLTGIAETDPDVFAIAGPPSDAADNLSWTYQYCTEFGMLSPFPDVGLVAGSDCMRVCRLHPGC